ncbi:K(+)-transporting ATPase subunit F [Alistipes sp.]
MCGLVRKNLKRKIMFIGLLILSLLLFIYLMYVLVKPEKF